MERQAERREQRNNARDLNRPNMDRLSPEPVSIKIDDDDDGWSDAEEEKPSSRSRRLDDSLEYQKNREDWMITQRVARRSRFSQNRRSSSEFFRLGAVKKKPLRDFACSEDWAQFQSCMSLKGDSDLFNEKQPSPKKTFTRNFIDSHHSEVNRMSDIYVLSSKAAAIPEIVVTDWSDVFGREFLLISFGILLAVCFSISARTFLEKD